MQTGVALALNRVGPAASPFRNRPRSATSLATRQTVTLITAPLWPVGRSLNGGLSSDRPTLEDFSEDLTPRNGGRGTRGNRLSYHRCRAPAMDLVLLTVACDQATVPLQHQKHRAKRRSGSTNSDPSQRAGGAGRASVCPLFNGQETTRLLTNLHVRATHQAEGKNPLPRTATS